MSGMQLNTKVPGLISHTVRRVRAVNAATFLVSPGNDSSQRWNLASRTVVGSTGNLCMVHTAIPLSRGKICMQDDFF